MDTKCDLCGEANTLSINPDIAVCTGCGFVYVPKRRSYGEVAESWNEIFGQGYTSEWPAVQARLQYVKAWFEQNVEPWNGLSVCEIGAGEGRFLDLVKRAGAYPMGIDPSFKNCQHMHELNIPSRQGTIEQVEPSRYDVTAILWTLENCTDCIGMLAKANSRYILVATGSRILVPYKKPLSAYLGTNAPDTHCFRFSRNTLEHALSVAGWQMTAVNRYEDSDWLVMAGERGEGLRPRDDAVAVAEFFRDWQRTFP